MDREIVPQAPLIHPWVLDTASPNWLKITGYLVIVEVAFFVGDPVYIFVFYLYFFFKVRQICIFSNVLSVFLLCISNYPNNSIYFNKYLNISIYFNNYPNNLIYF